jgi:glycosyltransferase involved in cell wall biosynthesis
MPFLSVLMPVKGNENYVGRAIKSTLLAMPKDSELLIHLDGPNSSLEEIVSGVNDSRVRSFQSEKPIGIAKSLNFLAGVSGGAYFARMDADDICLPWRFSNQIEQIENHKIDFQFTTCIVFGKSLRPLPVLPQWPISLDDRVFKKMLLITNPAVHPTALMRSDAFHELGGYRFVAEEDMDLWLRGAIRNFKFQRLRLPSILYRFHEKQISNNPDWRTRVQSENVSESLRLELATMLGYSSLLQARHLLLNELKTHQPFLQCEISGLPNSLKIWKQTALERNQSKSLES